MRDGMLSIGTLEEREFQQETLRKSTTSAALLPSSSVSSTSINFNVFQGSS
jgi:hypothetical protein